MATSSNLSVPRLEILRIRNYRALRRVDLQGVRPLSVFLGPNGSGKSTLFDVFAFLSECFTTGLRKAWDRRNRFRELRTRGEAGPIAIEFRYREQKHLRPITYHLEIDETPDGPIVAREWLAWRRGQRGQPFHFLDFTNGAGIVTSGEQPEATDERLQERLENPETLAVNTLGQFARHPRISVLRRFIGSWYLSYLTADHTRGVPEAGPNERLSITGDNLPNVIQYLKERHPERFNRVLTTLAERVPHVEDVSAGLVADGRLLLQIKDAPFARPILAKYASDGTLKMLAYLTVLYDPNPPGFIGIEEPENHLYPYLLGELAEECREATERTQLFVTTHSPQFVNALKSDELWLLSRGADGYTSAVKASDVPEIQDHVDEGAQLGSLWLQKYLDPARRNERRQRQDQ